MTTSNRCALRAATVVMAAGLCAPAYADDRNFNVAIGSWHTAGNWLENFVPTLADDVYIYGNRVAQLSLAAASARNVNLGWNNNGQLDHSAFLLTVDQYIEISGRPNGGTGLYNMSGTGRFVANRLSIGRNTGASGELRYASSQFSRTIDDAYVGNQSDGTITQTNGALQIGRDLTLGWRNGATGTWSLSGAGTTGIVARDAFVGFDNGSNGRINIGVGSAFGLGRTMFIGQWGSQNNQGLVDNRGRIAGLAGGGGVATIQVQVGPGQLTGTGTYDTKVQYNSAAQYGNSARASILVQSGVVTTSRALEFGTSLTARSGNAAQRASIDQRSITGSTANVAWQGGDFQHNSVLATPAEWNTVTMPYDENFIPDTGPGRANVRGRMRLMQIGQDRPTDTGPLANTNGQIVNITETVNNGDVVGKTPRISGGGFDLALIGRPSTTQHQNPAFRTLHERGLDGSGIMIGQMEPGTPDADHGCFENWGAAAGNRVTVNNANQSGHANRVASIMVGFDPLGLQTDGQGRFQDTAARQYNDGYGYKGIAFKSTLIADRSSVTAATVATRLDAMATAGARVINHSWGLDVPGGGAPLIGTGQHPIEKAFDRFVESTGAVMTVAAGNEALRVPNPPHNSIDVPAAAYNIITVGSVQFDDQRYPTTFTVGSASVANTSSRGPIAMPGGALRSGPHVVAQGRGNLSAFTYEDSNGNIDGLYGNKAGRGLYSTEARRGDTSSVPVSGTSFAAPTAAGQAALMLQRFDALDPMPVNYQSQLVKSVMMTSADKPTGWRRGSAAYDTQFGGNTDRPTTPLNFDWGAGLISPIGADDLIQRGRFVSNGPVITGPGYDYGNVTGESEPAHGTNLFNRGLTYFFQNVAGGTFITATLAWLFHTDATATPSDLDMRLYRVLADGTTVEQVADNRSYSNSFVDNFEHIHYRVPHGSSFVLRVWGSGSWQTAGEAEEYGLSWKFSQVPTPGVMALLGLAGLVSTRRRR